MKPNQQRVVDEKAELDSRLEKFNLFFGTATFAFLPDEEKERLFQQQAHMSAYSRILGERIAAFPV
jgi:hypothetical protein